MKIEKLNNDKIKILLSKKDYNYENYEKEELIFSDSNFQKFFLSILEKAEKENNFIVDDSKLLIELFFETDNTYVIYVTKYDRISNNITNKNIYCFETFEDFCEFCDFVNLNKNDFSKILKDSFLYKYNDYYYLLVSNIDFSNELFKEFDYILHDFSNCEEYNESFEAKLKEHGNLVLKQIDILNISKYI